MTVIIDGSASADFATPLPLTEGGTGTALATTAIVQRVNTQTGAVATGTATIPLDDTIPQNSEGDEYMTLAITPKHADNILEITIVANLTTSASNVMIAALFKDSVADAVVAHPQYMGTGNKDMIFVFNHTIVAGSTSEQTFKMRAGGHTLGTTTFNGRAGARIFGGVCLSSITITEYTA